MMVTSQFRMAWTSQAVCTPSWSSTRFKSLVWSFLSYTLDIPTLVNRHNFIPHMHIDHMNTYSLCGEAYVYGITWPPLSKRGRWLQLDEINSSEIQSTSNGAALTFLSAPLIQWFGLRTTSVSTFTLYGNSWQAELLALVAKDGWGNTMRIIIIWAFAHNIHKGYVVSQQVTITTTEQLACNLEPLKKNKTLTKQ
jgi:hypothetical protein